MVRPTLSFFPRFFLTRNEIFRKVIQLPLTSAVRFDVNPAPLGNFSGHMTGRTLAPWELTPEMRRLAAEQPDKYRSGLATGLEEIIAGPLQQHRSAFGLNPSQWPMEARRAVYAADLTTKEGGHAVAVVTFEPHPSPGTIITDPTLLRFVVGAFPGMAAGLPDKVFLEMLTAGREASGTPVDWLAANWDVIKEYNGKLLRDGAPLSGVYMLGSNSFVGAETHFVYQGPRFTVQSALMVTTAVHSQDGLVPWTVLAHPDFPGGVICVSLHFGRNAVPGGDMINSAIAAPLFKNIFRGGIQLALMYPDFVKSLGEERASTLLLDGGVHRGFSDYWWEADYRVVLDRAVLSVLDSTGGEVMNVLRFFFPETVATVESARLREALDRDAALRVITEGVDATRARGDTVRAGVEKSAPDDIVPFTDTVVTGRAHPTPETDPYNRTAPLGPQLDPDAATVARLSGQVDWDRVEKAVADTVARQTRDALAGMRQPFDSPVDDLVESIATEALQGAVLDQVNDTLLASLGARAEFAPLVERYGAPGARDLVSLSLGLPAMARMTEASGGTNYLSAAVRGSVLEARAHSLSENAGELQSRLAEAAGTVTTTRDELQARQDAVAAVNERLQQQPDDPSLQAQRDQLQQEIDALAAELEKAQEEQAEAERETERNERESAETAEGRREADGYLAERGEHVFHGE